RRNAADRCVDLFVVVENQLILGCVTSNMVRNVVRVGNLGPDLATSVFVDLTQNPAIAPSLRLVNPGASAGVSCTGTRCTIASVAAGTRIDLQAESGSFRNEVQQAPILSASVSGSEPDFATANNQSSIVDVFPPVSSRCSGINVDGGPVAISCFIATAAYGSALEPHVTALREFRDRYLQRSALGRAFIRFYYRHSPPIAAIIARHDSLRFVVRMLLAPLVFTVAFPWRALALMAVSAVLFIGWRRRYKASER
ncbi:MAG: hypothetical protein RL261_1423, partial [Pseudomonadota bacterium]